MAHDVRAGVGQLFRLGARLGHAWVRHPRRADPAGVACRWARELMAREGARGLELGVGGRTVRVVADATRSETVLGARPDADGWGVSELKTEAMSFLAPGALTVADGAAWRRLRGLNERVLASGRPHPFAAVFLAHVRSAFDRPVESLFDVREAMGQAMVDIVLGDVGPADPADDIATLFDVVQSPVRRKLLGFLYAGRRERLYRLLRRVWEETGPGDQTLLGLARIYAEGSAAHPEERIGRDEVLQQVPHWMFTFTGSGTDLLARTLAMIGSRPEVRRLVLRELALAGPSDEARTVDRMPYLNACILETGRLFPPVTRTFHRARSAGRGGSEVVHWFPLLQRADELGPSVHDFRPERWLGEGPDPVAAASNLFLRGPRQCPGMSLILFVCRAALALQIRERHAVARDPERLASDPLPVTFPAGAARFRTQRAT